MAAFGWLSIWVTSNPKCWVLYEVPTKSFANAVDLLWVLKLHEESNQIIWFAQHLFQLYHISTAWYQCTLQPFFHNIITTQVMYNSQISSCLCSRTYMQNICVIQLIRHHRTIVNVYYPQVMFKADSISVYKNLLPVAFTTYWLLVIME